MAKKRAKKKTDSQSGNKESQRVEEQPKRLAMVEFLSGIGAQVVSVVVFGVCLGFLFHSLSHKRWLAVLCWSLGTWIVVGVFLFLLFLPKAVSRAGEESPFLIDPETSVIVDTKGVGGNRFWVTYRSAYGDTASPVDVFMFLRLVNLQAVQTEVLKLSAELKIDDGPWIRLIHIPQVGTQAYFGSDLTHIRRIEMSDTGFDYLIQQKHLQSHEAVRGWVFFEIPQDYVAPKGTTVQYRITVEDAAGVALTHTSNPEVIGTKPISSGESDAVQPKNLTVREWANISSYRLKNYSDPVK